MRILKPISKHHPVQQKYKEKVKNKQDETTYNNGWMLAVLVGTGLLVVSWFFGGTFTPGMWW